MWIRKNKWKVILPVLVVAVLAAAFCMGGVSDVSGLPDPAPSVPTADTAPTIPPAPAQTPLETPTPSPAPEPTAQTLPETDEDKFSADPAPEEEPPPVEEIEADTARTCTLSVSCTELLDRLDLCAPETRELVPEDGWIVAPVAVAFEEGESVFDVLERVCRQSNLQMEFENTPVYNSAYVTGIQNLYEFDAGELSGWIYKVNGQSPNYGCSRCLLQDGDAVEWAYTCDRSRGDRDAADG